MKNQLEGARPGKTVAGTLRSLALPLVALALVGGGVTVVLTGAHHSAHPVAAPTPSTAPTELASTQPPAAKPTGDVPGKAGTPAYLDRAYVAPAQLVSTVGASGTITVPSVGISAPVDTVHLNGTVMAIPNVVSQTGWLDATAAQSDLVGASVIAGHVADDSDNPGALWPLRNITKGAKVYWTQNGHTAVFVVRSWAAYPRTSGVPGSVFRTDGPHILNLITCYHQITTANGGFHYTENLVVTAIASN